MECVFFQNSLERERARNLLDHFSVRIGVLLKFRCPERMGILEVIINFGKYRNSGAGP